MKEPRAECADGSALTRASATLVFALLAATWGSAQTLVFADSMTSFPAGWNRWSSNGVLWTRVTSRSHTTSAGYSAKCDAWNDTLRYGGGGPGHAYPRNYETRMSHAALPPSVPGGVLTFWRWCDTEDGKDSVVLNFFNRSTQLWYPVWWETGQNHRQWQLVTLPVPANVESLQFRFRSDPVDLEYEGVYIDDVVLYAGRYDVGLSTIVRPAAPVDSGIAVQPACVVYNGGNTRVSYRVQCRVGPDYCDSSEVMNHDPGAYVTVPFDNWVPGRRGSETIRCSTLLAGDANPEDDTASREFQIDVHDVACAAILAPVGELDSGLSVTPRALVRNLGTTTEDIVVRAAIGSFYLDSVPLSGLAPGESASVTLATRLVTAPRGSVAYRCSTVVALDLNPANDCSEAVLAIRVHDVGTDSIANPGPVVDSGTVLAPRAFVRNHGNRSEAFRCRLRIPPDYTDSQDVALAAGASSPVDFRTWSARSGIQTWTCSTACPTDLIEGNNHRTLSVFGRYLDARVSRIVSPNSPLDTGYYVPRVEIVNLGNAPLANVAVKCSLNSDLPGSFYQSTSYCASLAPGQCTTLFFQQWHARLGIYQLKARVTGAGDMNRVNDTLRKVIVVDRAHHDMGVNAFLSPPSQIDPGSETARVRVANFGSTVEGNVRVRLAIDSGQARLHHDSALIASIAPGEERAITFAPWTAGSGEYLVRSWTELAGDEQRGNDTARLSLRVARHNVLPARVIAPASRVGNGFPLHPRVQVRNAGTVADSFAVLARIERGGFLMYEETSAVSVAAGETADVGFPPWTPNLEAGYQFIARTVLASDADNSDDTLRVGFTVVEPSMDAAALRILTPYDTVVAGPVLPRVQTGNAGNISASFWLRLVIDAGDSPAYEDSVWVAALAPGETCETGLSVWSAQPGVYIAKLSIVCQGDNNPSNDVVTAGVVVSVIGRWTQCQSVPSGARDRKVKDGGCLAGAAGQAGAPDSGQEPGRSGTVPLFPAESLSLGCLYALKGNNTCEFYSYDLTTAGWTTRESIPAFGSSGRKKTVKKGAALCVADGAAYATKGNGTLEFWRYRPASGHYPWVELASVPPGLKKVKEGCGLARVSLGDTTFVYLLKGSGTQEFYRYNTATGIWQTQPAAPLGSSGRTYKSGSCLTGLDGTVYALKGSYNEFFAFRTDSSTWGTLTPLPMTGRSGRKKKVKDGAGLAAEVVSSAVYALKGGNTQEFWCWQSDSWHELAEIPLGTGRRVKGGGALTTLNEDLYALKGNNTLEFWCYDAPRNVGLSAGQGGNVQSEPARSLLPCLLAVAPNPVSARATISFTIRQPGHVRLRLFAVSGRQTAVLLDGPVQAGRHQLPLSLGFSGSGCRALARGVYLLRLETLTESLTRKLVVE